MTGLITALGETKQIEKLTLMILNSKGMQILTVRFVQFYKNSLTEIQTLDLQQGEITLLAVFLFKLIFLSFGSLFVL